MDALRKRESDDDEVGVLEEDSLGQFRYSLAERTSDASCPYNLEDVEAAIEAMRTKSKVIPTEAEGQS